VSRADVWGTVKGPTWAGRIYRSELADLILIVSVEPWPVNYSLGTAYAAFAAALKKHEGGAHQPPAQRLIFATMEGDADAKPGALSVPSAHCVYITHSHSLSFCEYANAFQCRVTLAKMTPEDDIPVIFDKGIDSIKVAAVFLPKMTLSRGSVIFGARTKMTGRGRP
jgi:hypothetical protein